MISLKYLRSPQKFTRDTSLVTTSQIGCPERIYVSRIVKCTLDTRSHQPEYIPNGLEYKIKNKIIKIKIKRIKKNKDNTCTLDIISSRNFSNPSQSLSHPISPLVIDVLFQFYRQRIRKLITCV